MRKLFILITFISSLLMSSVAHAEWTKVGKGAAGGYGDTYYVDFERIKKHDGKVYYWELTDYLKPTKNGETSVKAYTEAKCGRFGYRYLKLTFYKGPMASGTIILDINTPDKDWYYPSPNTSGEAMLNAVCNHKSMQ